MFSNKVIGMTNEFKLNLKLRVFIATAGDRKEHPKSLRAGKFCCEILKSVKNIGVPKLANFV